MIIKTKKWRNISMLLISFTVFVLFIEILPRCWEVSAQLWNYIINGDETKLLSGKMQEIDALKKENISLKQKIKNYLVDYDENKNLSSILYLLNKSSEEGKVSLISIKPKEIYEDNNLKILPVEIVVNSGYEGLYNFIRSLEGSSKIFTIKEVTTQKDEPGSSLASKMIIEFYLNL